MKTIEDAPLEITNVRSYLHTVFDGIVPLGSTGTAEQKETNFLSRSLAAFALTKLADCTVAEAADALVDGGGDNGIDAVHHADATNILWLVQSKFHRDGKGEPSLGDVSKFKNGIEQLLLGKFEAFQANQAWKGLTPLLSRIFATGNLQVRSILVYSGAGIVSPDRHHLFQDLHARFCQDDQTYFTHQNCNLTTIHDWVSGADAGPGVESLQLTLHFPGLVQLPYKTIYGRMRLADLAQIYATHGSRLVNENIRAYKGTTEVNEQILSTIEQEPEHFFYLNNGLTAYCDRFEVAAADRGRTEQKTVTAYGFSIVNGAQTLGSIGTFFRRKKHGDADGYAFVKLISLRGSDDPDVFADRITRSTNLQNRISPRDFASLDPQQERVAQQLEVAGITYHYKRGVDAVVGPHSFTTDEAITACACLANKVDCDICSRISANRDSLWAIEPTDPSVPDSPSRYSQIFRADLSARTVWRAVQIQRAAIEALKTTEVGIRKDFFLSCRWLVLVLLLQELASAKGNDLMLRDDELFMVQQRTPALAEDVWSACIALGLVSAGASGGWDAAKSMRSVFCSATDCAQIYSKVKAQAANVAREA